MKGINSIPPSKATLDTWYTKIIRSTLKDVKKNMIQINFKRKILIQVNLQY